MGIKRRILTWKKLSLHNQFFGQQLLITIVLVAPSKSGFLLLTVLATIVLVTLKNGIESIQS